jgi:AcrR family transcriptional regulator
MENKEKLLNAALFLFDEKGYQGVGIQEICNTVGVSKPTMYHYFGSKLGLFESIFETNLSEDIKYLEREASYNGNFVNSIQKLTFALAECSSRNTVLYHLLFSYILSSKKSEDSEVAQKYLNKIYEITLNLFTKSKEQNGNMNNREKQFTYSYLAVVVDYLNRHEMDENKEQGLYGLLHQFQFGINS